MDPVTATRQMLDSVTELVDAALVNDVDGRGGEELREELAKARRAVEALPGSPDLAGDLQEASDLLAGVVAMVGSFDPELTAELLEDVDDAG